MAIISIIIVTYNSASYITRCLESVRDDTRGIDAEVIVVDNCSSDDSAALVAAQCSDVRLIHLEENIGFGRACNVAAQYATGVYLLLLNPDTIVLSGAIWRLADLAGRYPHAWIWGGRTLNADGTPNPGSCGSFPSLWGTFCGASGLTRLFPGVSRLNGGVYVPSHEDEIARVDVVSGSFLLISKELWVRLEGFDPVYFLYGEEVDLCLRAVRLGARPLVWSAASVIHHGGLRNTSESRKWILLFQARATYMKRHWSKGKQIVGRRLLLLWVANRCIAFAVWKKLSGGDSVRIRASLWRSIWTARREWLTGFSEVERAQAGRVLPPKA